MQQKMDTWIVYVMHMSKAIPWDEFVCQYAAKNGHLDCLRYAYTQGCP